MACAREHEWLSARAYLRSKLETNKWKFDEKLLSIFQKCLLKPSIMCKTLISYKKYFYFYTLEKISGLYEKIKLKNFKPIPSSFFVGDQRERRKGECVQVQFYFSMEHVTGDSVFYSDGAKTHNKALNIIINYCLIKPMEVFFGSRSHNVKKWPTNFAVLLTSLLFYT